MILIVGLGNPGKKYIGTRHNLGKEIVQKFAKTFNFPKFKLNKKLKAEISENIIDNQKIILALPTTYMNESGQAVKNLIINYQLSIINLWVVHDDLDLPFGKIRISKNRSAGGHKGVQSIINQLGTQNFVRFRLGIKTRTDADKDTDLRGQRHEQIQTEKFVLEKFNKEEQKKLKNIIQLAIEALAFSIKNNPNQAMNKYNK
jgi:PTH1 family peptidyl-tRNA hydrolase